MLANPDLRPTDVLPEQEPDGTLRRWTLDNSEQHWGDEFPESVFGRRGLYPRMTRMLVSRCYAADGSIAGVLWNHARSDQEGGDDHTVYLPTGDGHWTVDNGDPLTLREAVECPCGTKGVIRRGTWYAAVVTAFAESETGP